MLNAYVSKALRIQAAMATARTSKRTAILALGKRQAPWSAGSKEESWPQPAFTPDWYKTCALLGKALQCMQSTYRMAAVCEHCGFGNVPLMPLLKFYHEAYSKPHAEFHGDISLGFVPKALEQLNDNLFNAYLPEAAYQYQRLGQSYIAYGVYHYQYLLEDERNLGEQVRYLRQLSARKYVLAQDQLCREIDLAYRALYPCNLSRDFAPWSTSIFIPIDFSSVNSSRIYRNHTALSSASYTSVVSAKAQNSLTPSTTKLIFATPSKEHAQSLRVQQLNTCLSLARGSITGLELLLKQQHNPLSECLLEQILKIESQPDSAASDLFLKPLEYTEMVARQCFAQSSHACLNFYCPLPRKQLRSMCGDYLQQCEQALRQALPFSLQQALINTGFEHQAFIQQVHEALAAAPAASTKTLPWKICFRQSSASHLNWSYLWQALYGSYASAAGSGGSDAAAKELTIFNLNDSRLPNDLVRLAQSAFGVSKAQKPASALSSTGFSKVAGSSVPSDPAYPSDHSAPTLLKPVLQWFNLPNASLLAQICSYDAAMLEVHWPCPQRCVPSSAGLHLADSEEPSQAKSLSSKLCWKTSELSRYQYSNTWLMHRVLAQRQPANVRKGPPLVHITCFKDLLQQGTQQHSQVDQPSRQSQPNMAKASLLQGAFESKAQAAQSFYSALLEPSATSQDLEQQDVLAGIKFFENYKLKIKDEQGYQNTHDGHDEQRTLLYQGLRQIQQLWQNYPQYMSSLNSEHGLVFHVSSMWHSVQIFSQALGVALDVCGMLPLKLAFRGAPLAIALCLAKLLPFLPEMAKPDGVAPAQASDTSAAKTARLSEEESWQYCGQILLNTVWQQLQLELPRTAKVSANFVNRWIKHMSQQQVQFLKLSSKEFEKISKLLELPKDAHRKHLLHKYLPKVIIDHLMQFNSNQALSELKALQQISIDVSTYLKNLSLNWFMHMLQQQSTTELAPHRLLIHLLSYVLKEPVDSFIASSERRLLLGALYVFSYAGQPHFSLDSPVQLQGRKAESELVSKSVPESDPASVAKAHRGLKQRDTARSAVGAWCELPSQDLKAISELKVVVHNFDHLTPQLQDLLLSFGRNLVAAHVALYQRRQCYALIAQYLKHRASCALSSPWLDLIDLAQICCAHTPPSGATSWATTALCHQLKAQVFKTVCQLYCQVTGLEPYKLQWYRSQDVELQKDFSSELKRQIISDINAHRDLLRIDDVQEFLIYSTPDSASSSKGE